jgi:hypothetical protein
MNCLQEEKADWGEFVSPEEDINIWGRNISHVSLKCGRIRSRDV